MTSLTTARKDDKKMPREKEPLTAKERKNRNLLVACMVIGGVIGIALTLVDPARPMGAFSDTPIPAWAAIGFAIVWGIIIPLISWQWHRTVDEQEIDAYKQGALYGFYVFSVGAPVWWILWRGGLLPPINGPILYYAVLMTCGVVWLRKKYG